MRRSLLAAASIAALATSQSWAQTATEINEEVNAPVDTATTNGGAPGDIVIGASGRVILDGAGGQTGPAVLINSNNSLEIVSGAQVEITDTDANGDDTDLNGAVGVQMNSGVTGEFTNNGRIALQDSYIATDSGTDNIDDYDGDGQEDDPDGEADGPFATDRNKTGLLIGEVDGNFAPVAGQGPVTGNVTNSASGRIDVAGQDSYGIRVVTGLSGDLINDGVVSIRGERSTGISVEADIGGDVQISAITATAPGGQGAVLNGDIGGGLRLTGAISVNGYRIPQRVSEELFRLLDSGDDDIDAGSAVVIGGSVRDGVFVSGRGAINQTSSGAPAVVIGSGGQTINLGEVELPDDFNEDRTDDDTDPDRLGYSVVNEGSITSSGIYDGRDNTAFLIGGFDSQGLLRTVILEAGGVLNSGSIAAIAYDGAATALRFGQGVTAAPGEEIEVVNTGNITASGVLGFEDDGFGAVDNPGTPGNEADYGTGQAFGLVLDSGSQIRRILNTEGTIIARVVGGGQSATAIKVDSNAVETIENNSVISAITQNLVDEWADGSAPIELIAIDARNHDGGLRVVQNQELDEDGEPVREVSIRGDVLFGSGADTLELNGGTMTGDVRFGEGADRLVINGGSLSGSISDSGGDLVVDVSNGTLVLTGSDALNLTEANFGDGGVLELQVDTTARAAAFLNASGAVRFTSGADLSVSLANLVGESAQIAILTAGDLDIADEAILDTTESPFLYDATLARDAADPNSLVLTLRRKTAAEVGLDESRAAAYDEALAAFESVEALGAAFAGVRTQQDFFSAYNQLLPEYASSAIQFALASNDAAAGALSVRLANARLAPDDLAGVWAQEFGYYADRSANAFGPGYRGQGVGIAVGLDRPMGPFYAVGFNVLGSASEVEEIDGFDEPMVALTGQIGTYAGLDLGGVDVSGAVALGYDFFESERNILVGEFASTNTAEWSGWHISASAKAGRDFTFNRWIVRPETSLTYLSLFESGYTETVSDPSNDPLALIVDDRESAALLGAATLTVSRRFGGDLSWWAPSVNVGYRGDFLSDEGETTAQFGETGSPFTLRSSSLSGSGVLLGFGLSAGSNYSTFSFAYDADLRDDFVRHVARLVIRLTF
ncbi:autotransporter outer membrane beta-barrel domain-containing protein [Maricaulaceae bacterium MS644]